MQRTLFAPEDAAGWPFDSDSVHGGEHAHLTESGRATDSALDAQSQSQSLNSVLPWSPITELRFARDQRLLEVAQCLRSTEPAVVECADLQTGVSEEDAQSAQRARLLALLQRTLALPLGRGAFTLRTEETHLTDTLPLPDLCTYGLLRLDQTVSGRIHLAPSLFPPSQMEWPSFHNGVAAALRARVREHESTLTSTWIVYNKPPPTPPLNGDEPTTTDRVAEHAGVLLGLGLQGHLRSLAVTRLYTYLSEAHSLTSIALLIGLGASRVGSCDQALTNLLAVHLPSMQTFGSGGAPMSHLEVPPLVQSAAIASSGLLYLGSGDRRHAELMLDEISIAPNSDRRQERECHALSAGLALGMICIGKGGSEALHDLQLAQRLSSLLGDSGLGLVQLQPVSRFASATATPVQPLPPFADHQVHVANTAAAAAAAAAARVGGTLSFRYSLRSLMGKRRASDRWPRGETTGRWRWWCERGEGRGLR